MTQLRCPTFVTQTTCWSASAIFGPCRHSSFPFPAYTVHTKLLPISSKFCFKRSAVISFNKIQFFLRSSSPISWVFEINRANLDRAVAQYSYSEIWHISPTIITAEDWTLELFLREIVQLGHFTTAWQFHYRDQNTMLGFSRRFLLARVGIDLAVVNVGILKTVFNL